MVGDHVLTAVDASDLIKRLTSLITNLSDPPFFLHIPTHTSLISENFDTEVLFPSLETDLLPALNLSDSGLCGLVRSSFHTLLASTL